MSACQRTGGQKGSVAHERSPVMSFQLCPFLPRLPHLRRAWDRRQRPASGFCAVWGKGGMPQEPAKSRSRAEALLGAMHGCCQAHLRCV